MAWYKAMRNARVGRERYLKDAVVELDPALLAGKEDNFVACDAPAKAEKPKQEKPKADPKPVVSSTEPPKPAKATDSASK